MGAAPLSHVSAQGGERVVQASRIGVANRDHQYAVLHLSEYDRVFRLTETWILVRNNLSPVPDNCRRDRDAHCDLRTEWRVDIRISCRDRGHLCGHVRAG